MGRQKRFWAAVLIVAVILSVVYTVPIINRYAQPAYGPAIFGRGMMGMMGPYTYSQTDSSAVKLSDDQIFAAVERVIGAYENKLEIEDIFFYADSDTYVSIEESDTGRGAMELLVNPYTGQVYPEQGPNMMWNEKYGMMGRHMAGFSVGNQISSEEAVTIANDYLKNAFGEDHSVMGQGHAFYGYFTFHYQKGTQPAGMLSVNAYTGDVWYHNWHGQLERVVEKD